MNNTVLVLGVSGRIGQHSAQAFAAAGWQVKQFNRRHGDMARDAQDADVIVNGMNPPNYHNWKGIIPEITEQVIEAASANGSTVILPGNVYHFGSQPGVWSEQTNPEPVSQKGEVRLAMEKQYKASGVQTIVLRAGNFIDPNRQGCVMSTMYLRCIEKNKLVVPGDATVRQAFCYLPDWARAAVALAEKRESLASFEDIPFPGHTLTAQELQTELENLLGRKLSLTRFPWWLMSLTTPVWELARELNEMRYLWDTDHALSDQRFNALLPGFKVTYLKTVLKSALPPELAKG